MYLKNTRKYFKIRQVQEKCFKHKYTYYVFWIYAIITLT